MGIPKLGNLEKGVFIYEDTSSSLVENKYVRYKKYDVEIYKEKFNDLICEGIIKEGCLFEDNKWIAYGNKNFRTFNFTKIEYNQYFYLPLKCFVILQLYDRRLVVDSVYFGLHTILKMIKMTGGYDKRFLGDFLEFAELKDNETKKGLSYYKHSNLGFIYFNPIHDSEKFVEVLLKFNDFSNEQVREIPTYSNFVLFDAIIHEFISNTTPYLRIKFYPVFIWWRLTSVIPIRPIEFIEILNEGIRHIKEDDSYLILVPRRKQQPDIVKKRKQIAIQHELKISKEMYNIILDFRKLANIENEKYLFPVSVFIDFLERPEISLKKCHYKEHISWEQMTSLLDKFFDTIVHSQYDIKVVRTREELSKEKEQKSIKSFNLGDTRHMAICMMMMQGFSELTIAQMAGHTNIRTQSHYSSHIDDFQRSYSGLLEKSILQKMNIVDSSGFDSFTFRQKQLLSYSNKDHSKARKISFGYCHSENFPNECFSKDCVFCNKFQLDLSGISVMEQDEMKNKITKIQDEIQIKLNFIKKYYSTFKKKGNSNSGNKSDLKELEQNAIKLNTLMNQESMMKAHLNKQKEVYETNGSRKK
jgi:hypothetical protein